MTIRRSAWSALPIFASVWGIATASDALVEEMKTFVKTKLAAFKYPRWVECVSELPKTATGKIQRYKLRELA